MIGTDGFMRNHELVTPIFLMLTLLSFPLNKKS